MYHTFPVFKQDICNVNGFEQQCWQYFCTLNNQEKGPHTRAFSLLYAHKSPWHVGKKSLNGNSAPLPLLLCLSFFQYVWPFSLYQLFWKKEKKTCTNPITNGYYEGVSPCNTIVVGVIVSCFPPEWIKLFYDSTKIRTIRNEFFNMAHSVYWYKLNWGVCVFFHREKVAKKLSFVDHCC